MGKDFVKIYNAIDKKTIADEKNKIILMQKAGLYPTSFDFPLTLQFELTSRCNVYCKHCYNNSGNNKNEDAMTAEKWIDLCHYVVDHGGIFECILSGGEPLLMGDALFDIMDILHDDGTSFLLITNGYLLDKEKVKRLAKYRYHWLQISIDGCNAEYHDDFRQRKGTWERAVKGAFMVSAEGIPLTIAHCVTPYNLDDIDKMCELAYELGASSIIIGEVSLSGRTSQNRDLLLNAEQKAILLEAYERNYNKYLGKMLVQRNSTIRNSMERYQNMPNSGLIVRPNGDLRLDCMAPFVIGNVLHDDFETVWKEKHVNCWKNPLVQEYIDNFKEGDNNTLLTNYVDKDIVI
jgi:MoaA/NifB/PqqE/SkfB family radical SAM enzyme